MSYPYGLSRSQFLAAKEEYKKLYILANKDKLDNVIIAKNITIDSKKIFSCENKILKDFLINIGMLKSKNTIDIKVPGKLEKNLEELSNQVSKDLGDIKEKLNIYIK